MGGAQGGGEVSCLGDVVVEVARHTPFPEVKLQAEVAAHALARGQRLVVDVARGVEVNFGVGGIVGGDAQALDRGIEDEAGREAVIGNRSADHAGIDPDRRRFLGAVADHGVEAAAPPFAEEADAVAGLARVIESETGVGALAGGGADGSGESQRVAGGLGNRPGVDLRFITVGLCVGKQNVLEGPVFATDELRREDRHPDRGHDDATGVGIGNIGAVLDDFATGIGLVETPLL